MCSQSAWCLESFPYKTRGGGQGPSLSRVSPFQCGSRVCGRGQTFALKVSWKKCARAQLESAPFLSESHCNETHTLTLYMKMFQRTTYEINIVENVCN